MDFLVFKTVEKDLTSKQNGYWICTWHMLQKNRWVQNNGIRMKFCVWWKIDTIGPNDVENVQHINDSYKWMNEWMNPPLPNGIECKFTTLNSDRTYLVFNHAISKLHTYVRVKRKERKMGMQLFWNLKCRKRTSKHGWWLDFIVYSLQATTISTV